MPVGDWSIIIVNYNGDPFLSACLEAIGRLRLRPKNVFVVDNASTDSSLYELHGYPWAEVLRMPSNLGFAGGANAGLARVETSVAVILNPDVEVTKDFGSAVVQAFADNARLGVAGALLTYPDGETVQHAGGRLIVPSMHTDHRGRGEALSDGLRRNIAIEFATGAAVGLRMDAVREVGGFDEQFAPVYYEDVDLSAQIRDAGWEVRLIPEMLARHHEGVTLAHDPAYFVYLHRNRFRYALKHLDNRQWSEEFVPLEIARMRHDLHTAVDCDGGKGIGVEAIEMLLRDVEPLADAGSAVWAAPSFPISALDIADLHVTRRVEGRPVTTGGPLLGRLRGLINSLGPRQYVDDMLEQQRAFNDSVVRAFEAQVDLNARQDWLNREQTAALLLIAVTLLGRLRTSEQPGTERG